MAGPMSMPDLANRGFRTVYSYSGEIAGLTAPNTTALETDEFTMLECGILITASSGGALNTSIFLDAYDPTGTTLIYTMTAAAALAAAGSQIINVWPGGASTVPANLKQWTHIPPWRCKVRLTHGAATSITGKIWVRGR